MSASMAEGIAEVLAAHSVDYREWSVEDDWNMIYKSICRTCGELPEAPNESAHQAEVLAANGYGKLTLVQLAERDRPESMEAARAKVRSERLAAQAERIRIAKAVALEEAADELARLQRIGRKPGRDSTDDERADYYAYAENDGDHVAWLSARAAAERGAA